MYYQYELQRILDELVEQEARLKGELTKLPEGTATVRIRDGEAFYFQRTPGDGNEKKVHHYSLSRKPRLLKKLLRKNYICGALRRLEKDIHVMEQTLKRYEPFDTDALYPELSKRFPGLPEEFYDPRAELKEWAAKTPRCTTYRPEGFHNTDAHGNKMRSKGELYIQSRLEYYNIPYVFEPDEEGLKRLPDFKIWRPRDGKVMYWEHNGLCFEEGYLNRFILKLFDYMEAHIYPWDNLILTYDNEQHGVDGKVIDHIIQGYLM